MSKAWVWAAALAVAGGCGDSGSHAARDAGEDTEAVDAKADDDSSAEQEAEDASAGGESDAALDGLDATVEGDASELDGGELADADADADALPDTPERFLPAVRSGTRLQARVLGGAGADPVFVAWWDSELSVVCEFAYAADGVYRCLPKLPGNSPTGHVSASCDDAPIVVNFLPACAEAGYLQQSAQIAAACPHAGQVNEVWSLAPMSAPAAYYDGSPDFCDGPRTPPAGGSFGALNERVDPASFVAGELSIVSDGDRLGVQVVTSEDGARLVLDPVDPRYGSCGQRTLYDEAFCAPSYIAYASRDLFADEGCSEPLVVLGTPDACRGELDVAAVIHDPTPSAGAYAEVRSIADPQTGTLYQESGATCTAHAASEVVPSGKNAFSVGPVSLLSLTSVARGDGPLKTLYLARDDGVLLRPGVFDGNAQGGGGRVFSFEDASGARCVVVHTSAGNYACMPADAVRVSTGTLFADSACTEPLASIPASVTVPDAGPSILYELDYDDSCARDAEAVSVREVYTAGALYEGAVYVQSGADCSPTTSAGVVYRVGASLLDTLPALSLSLL